jgi:pyruvate carboxylase
VARLPAVSCAPCALNVTGVAVWSEADASSLHIRDADEAISLGDGPAAQTYLVSEKIDAARQSGAQAIHPGYGFLSENAAFAEACEAAGIAFVGPTPEQLRVFGLKHGPRAGQSMAYRCWKAQNCWQTSMKRSRLARGRVPGDAEKHRGRRRYRDAGVL